MPRAHFLFATNQVHYILFKIFNKMFYGSNYLVTPEPYLIVTSLQASPVPAVTLEGQGHSPSPYYLLQPHRHFPTRASAVAGLALVLIVIAGCTLAKTIRELWKARFITLRSWRVQACSRATQWGWSVGNGGGRARADLSSDFIGIWAWVSEASWGHSLLANLKHKSGN